MHHYWPHNKANSFFIFCFEQPSCFPVTISVFNTPVLNNNAGKRYSRGHLCQRAKWICVAKKEDLVREISGYVFMIAMNEKFSGTALQLMQGLFNFLNKNFRLEIVCLKLLYQRKQENFGIYAPIFRNGFLQLLQILNTRSVMLPTGICFRS